MFEGFKRAATNVRGTDIAYVTAGSRPPLLLLHRFSQCKAMWGRGAPQLTDRYTVVCADLRGYGDSGKPQVQCPTLVFYGSAGQMAELFDIPAQWRVRCAEVTEASLPGGHFFVDQFPNETAQMLKAFLGKHA